MAANDRETSFIHTGEEKDQAFKAVVPPVYKATTYHHADPWDPPPYDYARSGNPTRQAFESALAKLEGGVQGFAFSSGMSAITAALMLFSAGDHLLVTKDCQGGTQRVLRDVFSRFGIEVSYVNTDQLEELQSQRQNNTKAVFVENFSNPFLRVTDIGQVSEWAKSWRLLTLVDNTFITPYLQRPLSLGADLVIHSASKMIAGHSDVTAGIAVALEPELAHHLYFIQNATGMALSPDDAYQAFRGLKTLPLRMDRAQASALTLAKALTDWPEVTQVYYPGLVTDPGHETAQRTANGFGAMLSFRLESPDRVREMVKRLRLTVIGAGFGGAETSISLPELHCHAALTREERFERGITSNIVRVSVGLENSADIVAEFQRAIHFHQNTARRIPRP